MNNMPQRWQNTGSRARKHCILPLGMRLMQVGASPVEGGWLVESAMSGNAPAGLLKFLILGHVELNAQSPTHKPSKKPTNKGWTPY